MDMLEKVLMYASFVVAGLVVVLNGIAPLTKNTKDDKVRDAFVWMHDKLFAFLLPLVKAKAEADKPKE